MLWTKHCLRVASSVTRGRLLAAVAPGNTRTKRTCSENASKKTSFATNLEQNFENDVNNLMAAYETSNFETTLMTAPKHVFWTAVLSITPLAAKTLVNILTMDFGDYASVATQYVSLYVTVSNAWWLANGGGDCSDTASPSPAPLLTPPSSFLCLQRAIAPFTLCVVSVIALPPFFAAVSVSYAAFKMACRLVGDRPGAVTQPWCKSLVLLLYGLNASFLFLASFCTIVC